MLSLWLILIATPLRSVLLPSARARSDKRTERAQNHEPVAFDDLPEPEHTPMPQQPAPAQTYSAAGAPAYSAPAYPVGAQGYTAPAYAAQPSRSQQPAQDAQQTSSLPEDPYERSRAMLFAQDPASSYRNNLIFDRDSRFNTYPRSSSVRPVEEGAQQSAAFDEAAKLIAEKENLEPSEEEYQEAMAEYAEEAGAGDDVDAYIEQVGEDTLKMAILRDAVTEYLVDECIQVEPSDDYE